jgi:hypothetical protein
MWLIEMTWILGNYAICHCNLYYLYHLDETFVIIKEKEFSKFITFLFIKKRIQLHNL